MKKKLTAMRSEKRRRPNGLQVWAGARLPSTELVDAMIKVASYRFGAFRRSFGRDPGPHEPLFFVEGLSRPVLAERKQVINQLSQAAEATGVELHILLDFLELRLPLRGADGPF
jgi:hypothetical protein